MRGALLIAGLFLTCATLAAADARPNILFIMTDDHAAHAISAYGSKINQTPNLDRLAAGGIRLTNCFVTNSICTPSRAVMLTGKYSHKNGVPVFNRLDQSQPTLAKYLKAAGYYTGVMGKWHLGSDPVGFDVWKILPGQGLYHDPVFLEPGKQTKMTGYATDLIVDHSIDFLNKRPKDKPFFLMCHHKAPHREFEPDDKHASMYDDVTIPEPATFNDDYATRSPAAKMATMTIERHFTRFDLKIPEPAGLKQKERQEWRKTIDLEMEVPIADGKTEKLTGAALKSWKYQKYIKDYLRCVASVDDNVGRLLDYLDKQGLTDNTIVVYTSDQGFFLGDHGWYDKRFMYEECLRTPFIVRWSAKIKAGSTSDKMLLNADFAPTLLGAAGLSVPDDMQGKNALPILEGQPVADWRTSMYYRYYDDKGAHNVQRHYGVRTEKHKLIYFHTLDAWELYDLDKDPRELNNVYADPAYAPLVTQLKAELQRLRETLDDRDQFAEQKSGGV